MSEVVVNDNLVMICGEPIAGKTASLMKLDNHPGVMYLNCDAGKKPPFANKFEAYVITDPYDIYDAFEHAEERDDIHSIIVDTQTFLMDMFESIHVIPSADTQKAWGSYAEYFRNLMQLYVARSTKNVIFTAHIESYLNEEAGRMEKKIPVKGQLGKKGIEAFFSCIVTARVETTDRLKKFANPLLTISEDEEEIGVKHVFQTRPTKATIGERGMRAPMDMWSRKETFINNDCQLVMDRLNQFYNE